MLLKVKIHGNRTLYFDATRVLFVEEMPPEIPESARPPDWPLDTAAKVWLDSEKGPFPIHFTPQNWPGVRILLGIDTCVTVEAT